MHLFYLINQMPFCLCIKSGNKKGEVIFLFIFYLQKGDNLLFYFIALLY
jgi:hypothetical protein